MAGRGYQFTAEIRTMAAMAPVETPSPVTNLPEAVSELIGREADLRGVTELVTNHRLVMLVGAGGIGKTRLGLEVARRLLPRFPDGVFVAELGPLSSPDVVPATVATALGLTVGVSTVSREGIAAAEGAKQLLLVVDNCEHLIPAAAGIVRGSGDAHRGGIVELAEAVGAAGQVAEGLRVVDDALAGVERTEEASCLANLLRAKGELFLRQREGALATDADAERCLRQALDVARREDALSWELRTATSLARLWSRQGRIVEACNLLAPVYRRFTEGFGTADLVGAKTPLASLRS